MHGRGVVRAKARLRHGSEATRVGRAAGTAAVELWWTLVDEAVAFGPVEEAADAERWTESIRRRRLRVALAAVERGTRSELGIVSAATGCVGVRSRWGLRITGGYEAGVTLAGMGLGRTWRGFDLQAAGMFGLASTGSCCQR